MSETKFTKGEWTFNVEGTYSINAPDKEIAVIDLWAVYRTMTEEEKLANGHLMAAAPDLYEACKEMMEELARQNDDYRNGFGGHEELVEKAQKALAKARGEK